MTQKNSIQDLRNKPRNIDEKVSKMNKKCRPENWDGKGRVESKKIWKLKRMNQVEIKGEKNVSAIDLIEQQKTHQGWGQSERNTAFKYQLHKN